VYYVGAGALKRYESRREQRGEGGRWMRYKNKNKDEINTGEKKTEKKKKDK
jgi:hypothetical protein